MKAQHILDILAEIYIDLFAGGGGVATGIEQALGHPPHVGVNHSDAALSMHRANHPFTRHFAADVFEVCPKWIKELFGRLIAAVHLSPDCTDFSQSAAGQPRDKKIRSLSWVGKRWAGQASPRFITLENVRQIQKWGPLIAKRCKVTGRVIKKDGSVATPGERTPVHDQFLIPDPRRLGKTWRKFLRDLERLGYEVQHRILCAADYGDPTTRERLIMIARRDGRPIVWPEPTHAKRPQKGQKPWRTAAECIDWHIKCTSIFGRKRPLAEATLKRIAKGLKRYVLDHPDPFIVPPSALEFQKNHEPIAHHRKSAYLMQANSGFCDTVGQDAREPMTTITTSGSQQQLVTAFLARQFGNSVGQPVIEPAPCTTAGGGGKTQLIVGHLAHLRQNCHARDLREPLQTISAAGQHHALVEYTLSPDEEAGALRVASFLLQYYSEGGQWGDLRDPMPTITTKDRLALVTVTIQGHPYVIVDIGLRMLTPRELYRAQGFPEDYIIDRGHDGRKFTKDEQVRMVGNSVPPGMIAAIYRANLGDIAIQKVA